MPLLETRGAASAKGFGFGAGGEPVVDWYKLILVPYNPGTSDSYPTRLAFFNPATFTSDFDIPLSGMSNSSQTVTIMRVKKYVYYWNGPTGLNAVRGVNIFTGASLPVQDLSMGLDNGDIAKIGNNGINTNPSAIVTAGKNGTSMRVWIWRLDEPSGLFGVWSTADLTSVFGYSTPSGGAYSTPQIAPVGTISLTGGVPQYAYLERIGYVGLDGYPGPTYTRYALVAASYAGSISMVTSFQDSNNFSRPKAAMIPSLNGAYVATFDGAPSYVFDSSGTVSGMSTLYTSSETSNGWGPSGVVLGSSSARAFQSKIEYEAGTGAKLDSQYRITSSGASLLAQSYVSPYFTVTAVQQTGYNDTYGAWYTQSYQYAGNNYGIVRWLQENGTYGFLSGPGAYLTNIVINGKSNTTGQNTVSRVINYGE